MTKTFAADSVLSAIGGTPVVRLRRVVSAADAEVLVKLESTNPTGSHSLLVGTSSALNIAAAVQLARELGPAKVVATVAVDTGLKYLAGDLFEA
jgi:cysteine synthase